MRAIWEDRALLGGPVASRRVAGLIMEKRMRHLGPSRSLELQSSPHQRGPVVCLDLELAEERHLLTGGLDCSISLFDLEGRNNRSSSSSSTTACRRVGPMSHVARGARENGRGGGGGGGGGTGGHTFAVASVQWYPVDTGAFVSAGHDGRVKLWDTNTFRVVAEVSCGKHAYVARMPPLARLGAGAAHCLVAVGCDDNNEEAAAAAASTVSSLGGGGGGGRGGSINDGFVRLCDMRTRSAAHRLCGHRAAVWSLDWSPASEFVLATGAADGVVRLWDVRRSGDQACLASLDMHMDHAAPLDMDTHLPHKTTLPSSTSSSSSSSSLSSGQQLKKRTKTAPPSFPASGGRQLQPTPHRLLRQFAFSRVSSTLARAHTKPCHSVAFAPGGRYLLTAGTDHRLKIWDVHGGGGSQSPSWSRLSSSSSSSSSTSFSSSSSSASIAPCSPVLCPVHLSGVYNDREHAHVGLCVVRPSPHRALAAPSFPPPPAAASAAAAESESPSESPSHSAQRRRRGRSPREATRAMAAAGGGYRPSTFRVFYPNNPGPEILCFDLDLSRSASAADDGHGYGTGGCVVEVADGRPEQSLQGHMEAAHAVAFRPSTQQLLSVASDGLVLVWEHDSEKAAEHSALLRRAAAVRRAAALSSSSNSGSSSNGGGGGGGSSSSSSSSSSGSLGDRSSGGGGSSGNLGGGFLLQDPLLRQFSSSRDKRKNADSDTWSDDDDGDGGAGWSSSSSSSSSWRGGSAAGGRRRTHNTHI